MFWCFFIYIEEVHEEEKTFEQVFRNQDGEIVDVVRGVKEMFQKDATWANVAYRVSSELPDSDREILTGLAMTYLRAHVISPWGPRDFPRGPT